jgi:hypothetical protein
MIGFLPEMLCNMDQTAVYFDPSSNKSIAPKGSKDVSVRQNQGASSRVTVCLTVFGDGTKLPPFIIFKGIPGKSVEKSLKSINDTGEAFCVCQANAWSDSDNLAIFIQQILKPAFDKMDIKPILLVDSFKAHLTGEFVRNVAALGGEVEHIPGGMTPILQPVDVGVNKPFKNLVRKKHSDWKLANEKSRDDNGRLRAPTRHDVAAWIIDSWKRFPSYQVRNSFVGCGYYYGPKERCEPLPSDEAEDDNPFDNLVDETNEYAEEGDEFYDLDSEIE